MIDLEYWKEKAKEGTSTFRLSRCAGNHRSQASVWAVDDVNGIARSIFPSLKH